MLLGIDIGTSGIKAALVHPESGVVREHREPQDILTPKPGWAEQNPEAWLKKTGQSVRAVLKDGDSVKAVSFSGHMHGIVVLDKEGTPLRNAIIWADARSNREINEAMQLLGTDRFRARTINRLAAGFGLASLLWLKKHEPETFGRIHTVLCVKDYVRYRLCGELAQDDSDASATCCMDVEKRVWADDILTRLGMPMEIFPRLGRATDLAGHISAEGVALTGLAKGTPVYFGGGDQGVASIGAGIVRPGVLGSNIGTGGQVTTCVRTPVHDPLYRTSTFIHAIPECWTMFGAVLSAGLSLKWLQSTFFPALSFAEMDALANQAAPGCEGLLFLPHLTGERTPYFDPSARGIFWGMTLKHGAPEIIRAVMEGVGYAMRQCFEILEEAGAAPQNVIAMGGGAKSPLWMQIQADMYGIPVQASSGGDACTGAAILAGYGSGVFSSIQEGAATFVRQGGRAYEANPATHNLYMERKDVFGRIYVANAPLFDRTK